MEQRISSFMRQKKVLGDSAVVLRHNGISYLNQLFRKQIKVTYTYDWFYLNDEYYILCCWCLSMFFSLLILT